MAIVHFSVAPYMGKEIVNIARQHAYYGAGRDKAFKVLVEAFGDGMAGHVDAIIEGKKNMTLADAEGNMGIEDDCWEAPWSYDVMEKEIRAYMVQLSNVGEGVYEIMYRKIWSRFGGELQKQLTAGITPGSVELYREMTMYVMDENPTLGVLLMGGARRMLEKDSSEDGLPTIREVQQLLSDAQELDENRGEMVSAEADNEFRKKMTDGWLSPQGDFYPCKTYQHIQLADALGFDERELEANLWCKISHGSVQLPVACLSKKQIERLFDYAMVFNNGNLRLAPFDGVLVPMKAVLDEWESEHRE